MNKSDLKKRTRQFGLRAIRLVESLPGTQTARTIGDRLLRDYPMLTSVLGALADIS